MENCRAEARLFSATKRKMKKFMDIFVTVLMIVIFIFAFLIVGMRLFGLKPYAVISGSMEPTYHVGSMIYVKKTTAAELKVGDPITYVINGGTVVTHRIVEVLPDEDNPTVVRYRVKGDANKTADGEPVHINNVIGKPVFTIPLIGYVAYYVQNPPGCYILIIVLMSLFILSFIPNIYEHAKKYVAEKEERAVEAAAESETDDPAKLKEAYEKLIEQKEAALKEIGQIDTEQKEADQGEIGQKDSIDNNDPKADEDDKSSDGGSTN